MAVVPAAMLLIGPEVVAAADTLAVAATLVSPEQPWELPQAAALAVEVILLPTALAAVAAWEFLAKGLRAMVFIHPGMDKIAQAVAEIRVAVEVVVLTVKTHGAGPAKVPITSMADNMAVAAADQVQAGQLVLVTVAVAQFELFGAIL
jgi:hypothetical protein